MKKQSIRVALRRVMMTSAVAAIVLLSNPLTGRANNSVDSVATASKQPNIQFLGSYDNSVWFDVKFSNPTGEKFDLIIKDATGDVLYRGQFSDKSFDKKIKFLNEAEELRPTFVIKTAKKEVEQTFAVSTLTKTDIVVTKL
ncbi:MAG: hypothetical protein J0I41_06795 [Filimonas sp.]|nr:hypothetical protein [Filimonas sp.]